MLAKHCKTRGCVKARECKRVSVCLRETERDLTITRVHDLKGGEFESKRQQSGSVEVLGNFIYELILVVLFRDGLTVSKQKSFI